MTKEQGTASRTRRRTVQLLVLLALFVTAFYGGKAIVRARVDTAIQGPLGKVVPPFSLPKADGSGVMGDADVKGRPLLLHFFRSHCEACEAEAEAYRQLEGELDGKVVLLHVMGDRVMEFSAEVTAATLARKQFKAPVLFADAAFLDAFHSATWARVTPVTYAADATGTIRVALRGKQTLGELRAAVLAVRPQAPAGAQGR